MLPMGFNDIFVNVLMLRDSGGAGVCCWTGIYKMSIWRPACQSEDLRDSLRRLSKRHFFSHIRDALDEISRESALHRAWDPPAPDGRTYLVLVGWMSQIIGDEEFRADIGVVLGHKGPEDPAVLIFPEAMDEALHGGGSVQSAILLFQGAAREAEHAEGFVADLQKYWETHFAGRARIISYYTSEGCTEEIAMEFKVYEYDNSRSDSRPPSCWRRVYVGPASGAPDVRVPDNKSGAQAAVEGTNPQDRRQSPVRGRWSVTK
jgi:hypothetical protein